MKYTRWRHSFKERLHQLLLKFITRVQKIERDVTFINDKGSETSEFVLATVIKLTHWHWTLVNKDWCQIKLITKTLTATETYLTGEGQQRQRTFNLYSWGSGDIEQQLKDRKEALYIPKRSSDHRKTTTV